MAPPSCGRAHGAAVAWRKHNPSRAPAGATPGQSCIPWRGAKQSVSKTVPHVMPWVVICAVQSYVGSEAHGENRKQAQSIGRQGGLQGQCSTHSCMCTHSCMTCTAQGGCSWLQMSFLLISLLDGVVYSTSPPSVFERADYAGNDQHHFKYKNTLWSVWHTQANKNSGVS